MFSQRPGEDWRGLQALSFGAEVDMGAPTGPSAAELSTVLHLKFSKKCCWGLLFACGLFRFVTTCPCDGTAPADATRAVGSSSCQSRGPSCSEESVCH